MNKHSLYLPEMSWSDQMIYELKRSISYMYNPAFSSWMRPINILNPFEYPFDREDIISSSALWNLPCF